MNTPQPPPERLRAALAKTTPAETPKPMTTKEAAGQTVRASLCLYPCDEERIEEIRAALAAKGHKITPSDALRLALRGVEIKPKRLLRLLEAMKLEDGRTRRFEN